MLGNEHLASAGSCILTVAHWCLDVKGCLQRFLWFPLWEVSICIHVLFWIQVQVNFAEICKAMYWLVKPQVVAVNAFSDSSLSETGGVAPRCEDELPSPPSHSLKKAPWYPSWRTRLTVCHDLEVFHCHIKVHVKGDRICLNHPDIIKCDLTFYLKLVWSSHN